MMHQEVLSSADEQTFHKKNCEYHDHAGTSSSNGTCCSATLMTITNDFTVTVDMKHECMPIKIQTKCRILNRSLPSAHFGLRCCRSSTTCNKSKRFKESEEKRKRKLFNKMKLLLLLLYNSKFCKEEEPCLCKSTAHCDQMGNLWKHISTCANKTKCGYPLCYASRYVLHHYRACKNPHCQLCAPVRAKVMLRSSGKARNKNAV